MACDVILDVVNYVQVPAAPDQAIPELARDETWYTAQARHKEAKAVNEMRERFFQAVRWFLQKQTKLDEIRPEFAINPNPGKALDGLKLDDAIPGLTNEERARFLAVAGILIAESQVDPLNGKNVDMLDEAAGDELKDTKAAAPFKTAMTKALAEYNTYPDLYLKVFDEIRTKSKVGADRKFRARQIAEIARRLVGERIRPSDSQFGAHFERALASSLTGAIEGRQSSIDIDLPDLEAGTEADIISDNVMALSAIYFAAMLEELKFFNVMDKVVEQFMTGALPIKRSVAGDPLYRYHRDAQLRINEFERRGLYARSFGVAQGAVDEPLPNREFNDLWIRFLSAVSLYGREKAARSSIASSVSREQVFKSARDLAVNLSLHGFGLAHFAAVELQNLVRTLKDTLSNPDVIAAYGVRDVWQLVERVSNMYLGGAVNGVRQRTMAQSGAAIIKWLALNSPNLIGTSRELTVDDSVISQVERWLAVTGTPDSSVERYSEPVALSNQRTIPDFALPSGAASDALRDAMSRVPGTIPQN